MAQIEHRAALVIIAAFACWSGLPGPAAFAVDDGAPPAVQETAPAVESAAPPPEGAVPPAAEKAMPVNDGPPVLLAVTGVRSDDVLHLRDVPSADSKSLAGIPPNARGLKKIGCMRVQLSMDRYMYMSKEERNYAQAPWCRVEYKGLQGWVAARYVKEEGTTKR
jgi:hypothetical protein